MKRLRKLGIFYDDTVGGMVMVRRSRQSYQSSGNICAHLGACSGQIPEQVLQYPKLVIPLFVGEYELLSVRTQVQEIEIVQPNAERPGLASIHGNTESFADRPANQKEQPVPE